MKALILTFLYVGLAPNLQQIQAKYNSLVLVSNIMDPDGTYQ